MAGLAEGTREKLEENAHIVGNQWHLLESNYEEYNFDLRIYRDTDIVLRIPVEDELAVDLFQQELDSLKGGTFAKDE